MEDIYDLINLKEYKGIQEKYNTNLIRKNWHLTSMIF